jgi:hypothetical protein
MVHCIVWWQRLGDWLGRCSMDMTSLRSIATNTLSDGALKVTSIFPKLLMLF